MTTSTTPPTLRSVAALAGVSTATVVRVLRGSPRVAEPTRARVEQAVEATGYRINAVASGLRRQRTETIGQVLHDQGDNPFFSEIALGLQEAAARSGMDVFVVNAQHDVDRERAAVEAFLRRRVDAIVLTTPKDAATVEVAVRAGVRVVQIEQPTPVVTPTVTVDNASGARLAVEHLAGLGHRRIAYLGLVPHPDASAGAQRLRGYREAVRGLGLPGLETLCLPGDRRPFHDQGADLAARALAAHPGATALFVAADPLAAGVLQHLDRVGLRVPRDVSVLGFDDTLAAHLTPPLSTMAVPMRALGAAAFACATDEDPETRATFGATLHQRGSTASPSSSDPRA